MISIGEVIYQILVALIFGALGICIIWFIYRCSLTEKNKQQKH